MKLSLIVTVYNEENSISDFINSVIKQTILPSELIIVDGGSTDNTVGKIEKAKREYKGKLKIKLIEKKGNRAVGRNEAIRKASSEIILSSDSGNVLDKDWVKNITKGFSDSSVDVVAGYYKGLSKNIFQKSLIPYVLVMPDKVDNKNFLPATRSMAFKKNIWKKVGGFDEKLSHNEDFAFANKLKEKKAKIVFAKDAIVKWIPRNNIFQALKMFFRFAYGDVQAKILRTNVAYLFLRYIFIFYLLTLVPIMKSLYLNGFLVVLFCLYIIWSISKNYRYVKNYKAFFYLPLIQFTADVAILSGSTIAFFKNFSYSKIFKFFSTNKVLTLILLIFIFEMLLQINWGIPNINHPFDYFMDEWHQSQAVRDVFKFGTPNLSGAANGSMFHFYLSGIFLLPFYLFGLINPFVIKSSILNISQQHLLFEVFRLNTLFFAVSSGILIFHIAKKYFNINGYLVAFIFLFNPLFIMLSNYFKYDIDLVFWITLALWGTLRFINNQTLLNNIIASMLLAITLSVKLSTPTLFVAYLTILLVLNKKFTTKAKLIFVAIVVYIFTFLIFGISDAVFGKGNPIFYLTENLTTIPNSTINKFNLGGISWLQYLVLTLYPLSFGKIFYFSFIISLLYFPIKILKNVSNISRTIYLNRNIFVVFLYFLFLLASLYSLNIEANGNRLLVILPFMSIITVYVMNLIYKKNQNFKKQLLIIIVSTCLIFQFLESSSWLEVKIFKDIREISSQWIMSNLKSKSEIGIENIPIYQFLPDIVVKDFYSKQYDHFYNNLYNFKIISSKTNVFPKYVILTNDFEGKFVKNSEKEKIVNNLIKNKYTKVKQFNINLKCIKFFNPSNFDYFMSNLTSPVMSISIYEK